MVISILLRSNRYPTYQDDLPLLYPVVLLLMQLFLIIGHDLSHSLYAFQGLGNAGTTFNLCRHVMGDGLGDWENIGEVGRHVEVVDDDEDT